jgi:hypothetical protein
MQDDQPNADELPAYQCPACGASVGRQDPQSAVLQCPSCGGQFFASDEEGVGETTSQADDDARAAAELEAKREAELSEMRIHQISQLRRGATRSRSWFIVGVLSCAIGAVLLIFAAITDFRRGLRIGPMTDAILAAIALLLLPYFRQRIRTLDIEIGQSRLEEPSAPPDLSTLSDGSQQWTNLDEMVGREEDK